MEITVLKTIHQGIEEAKKLEPYIKKADVYVPELALATETIAAYHEKNWENFLSNESIRLEDYIDYLDTNEESKYLLEELKIIRNSKAVKWHLERFSEKDYARFAKVKANEDKFLLMALRNLKNKQFDESYFYFYKTMKCIRYLANERDKEIARNIESAEERLKIRYSQLRMKENFSMVVQIGAMHNFEKYSKYPISVVNLCVDEPIEQLNRIIFDYIDSNGKSKKDIREEMLKLMLIGCSSEISEIQSRYVMAASRFELERKL